MRVLIVEDDPLLGDALATGRPGYGGDGPRIRNLFVKSTGDTKPPTLLAIDTWAWDWSPNGVYVLTTLRRGNNRGFDIGYLEINGEAPYTAKPLRTTKYREAHAQFSPDGRYVAFQSDDTGQDEIYVCSFPDCLDEKKVSLDGGMFPRWAKKQGSLYYRRGEDTLMEAPIKTQPELDVGMPRRLFSNLHLYQQGAVGTRLYDVSDDGERFVVVESAPSRISPENPATINVWQNWAASLKDETMD
jgi:dipeptidyl aminopeptidase/acylaminoacyl peptidase